MIWIVNAKLIEIQGNGMICWSGDGDPAVRKSLMKDMSLFTCVISIAIRCTVFELEAFMIIRHRFKSYLNAVAVTVRKKSILHKIFCS